MIELNAVIVRDGDFEEAGKPFYNNLKDDRLQDWDRANVVVYIDAYGRPYVVKNKFGKCNGPGLYKND
jgi:hypothetical protein